MHLYRIFASTPDAESRVVHDWEPIGEVIARNYDAAEAVVAANLDTNGSAVYRIEAGEATGYLLGAMWLRQAKTYLQANNPWRCAIIEFERAERLGMS